MPEEATGTLGAMNSQRPSLGSTGPSRLPRPLAIGLLALCSGISLLAFADGPTQPDPPVPLEGMARPALLAQASVRPIAQAPARAAPVTVTVGDRDLDCRCAVLHSRDMESRIEGHVERWEALSRAAQGMRPATRDQLAVAHTSFVDGVVGFPMHQFRLAADEDDGAGSD